jgi:cytochrome P450
VSDFDVEANFAVMRKPNSAFAIGWDRLETGESRQGGTTMSTKQPLPTDLELTALDPVFREHPHDRLDRLRAEDPVHFDAALGRQFLTRFEDMKTVLADRSLSKDPRKAPDTPRWRAMMGDVPLENAQPSMLNLDDPDHKRLRALVSQAFNQRSIDAWRPRIRVIAEGLLDAFADRVSFDLIAGFAVPLPIVVIAEMLGVDPGDMAQFKRWSDARVLFFNPVRTPEQTAELRAAGLELNDYFARAIDARRGCRGEDLISLLVAAEEAGDRLSAREIAITCNLLLIAGNLTTTDLIGNGVLALLRHPDQLANLCAHPELVPDAVEETLRYDPPVVRVARFALEPLQIGGREVRAGQTMTCSLLAAGHDPALHSDAHRFDIERADTTHLAFGGGAHYCLGAPLARAEAQIAIATLFARFPSLQLDPEHAVEHKRSPVFNGLEALWVRAA